MNKRMSEDLLSRHLGSEPCVCTVDPSREGRRILALRKKVRSMQGFSAGVLGWHLRQGLEGWIQVNTIALRSQSVPTTLLEK